jgi:hypothetical protein
LANVAILIGNTKYETLGPLACCGDDVIAVKELLEATEKFDSLEVVLDSDSSQLKERIRAAIDAHKSVDEIFFYFTGHGFQHETDFFYCATNFDAKRPNETGLSNSELHVLLRSPQAVLVVKVIDACNSGTLLVKANDSFFPASKQGFKNLIQIASCLDSQNSLTGNPLSLFTEKFREAALRKTDGAIYYTDIIDALRDEFLDNNNQTPHFVSQGTGREQFVENAKRLDGVRAKLCVHANETAAAAVPVLSEPSISPFDVLERAEKQFVKRELAQTFISQLFDKLSEKASADNCFQQLFSPEVVVHSDFQEDTARAFIIRVLSGEKRPDNFVTAEISRERRRRHNPFGLASAALLMFAEPDEIVTNYELRLNCSLDKVELKIAFTPKFTSLQRFVLVVSCAPSLEVCYIMEVLTRHLLTDWGVFDSEGAEVVRRWYKRQWTDSCDGLVEKIWEKTKNTLQENIDTAVKLRQP